MIDLSIIIVNWNTKGDLIRSLRSIAQRNEKDRWEIFVIDNGSCDGSGDEVKRVFPGVRLVENKENLGFAKATNQGVQQSSGKQVLLLNPDTEVKEGGIEALFSFMDSHPEAGIAGVQLRN